MIEEVQKTVKVIRPTREFAADCDVKRFAAYCRVSTDSDDQANSFLTQVRYYTELARDDPKFELVDIYADEGITGTCVSKREEFKRLLKDCELGKIDIVYVKSVQRFARNSLECLEAVRKMSDCGVTVFFENDNINTKKMNSEMILYIKSAFAQNEALTYSNRLSMSYRMKMEDGTFITYHAPFGYRLEGQQLVVVPEEADIIKRIFELYLSGCGISKITGIMNQEYSGMRQNEWNNIAIRYILENEKYIGDSMLQKTYTPQVFPLHSRTNKGQKDRFYIENTHEAIISKEDYQAVQQRLKEHYGAKKPGKDKYLFSKVIVCSHCERAYRRKVQNGIVYWTCSTNGNAGRQCGGPNLQEEEIKAAFVRMYNRFRFHQKELLGTTISLLTEARTKVIAQRNEVSQIDAEIAKLASQSDMYHKLHSKNIMDDVSFAERIADVQERLTTLRTRRMKLLSEDDESRCIEQLHQLQDTLEELPKALLTFQTDVFEAIIDKIKVDEKKRITFVMKGGLRLAEPARRMAG